MTHALPVLRCVDRLFFMKYRIVIPDEDMQPLPGESPADAIHRAVIGRPLREMPVGTESKDEDESS